MLKVYEAAYVQCYNIVDCLFPNCHMFQSMGRNEASTATLTGPQAVPRHDGKRSKFSYTTYLPISSKRTFLRRMLTHNGSITLHCYNRLEGWYAEVNLSEGKAMPFASPLSCRDG